MAALKLILGGPRALTPKAAKAGELSRSCEQLKLANTRPGAHETAGGEPWQFRARGPRAARHAPSGSRLPGGHWLQLSLNERASLPEIPTYESLAAAQFRTNFGLPAVVNPLNSFSHGLFTW